MIFESMFDFFPIEQAFKSLTYENLSNPFEGFNFFL